MILYLQYELPFKCTLEYVMEKAKLNRNRLIYTTRHQVLITRTVDELKRTVKSVVEAALGIGLQINENKTNCMTWTDMNITTRMF